MNTAMIFLRVERIGREATVARVDALAEAFARFPAHAFDIRMGVSIWLNDESSSSPSRTRGGRRRLR